MKTTFVNTERKATLDKKRKKRKRDNKRNKKKYKRKKQYCLDQQIIKDYR